MKKFKYVTMICLVMAAIAYGCKTRFETTHATYHAVVSPIAFQRGKELTFSICAGCHYDHNVNKFIGTQIHDVPGIAGKVYSANLTHSKTNGIAPKYTDAEIRHLLKTGIARDGRFLEYMLRPNMAEEDINAIIVYLRSDDPAVAPADTTIGLTHFTFIGKAYMNIQAKPETYKANVSLPTDKVALGYYLVDNLGCFHCHSKSLTKLNLAMPNQTQGYLAGGMKMKGEGGVEIRVANITPDKNTGIGNYSPADFRRALVDGRAPDRELKIPMPKFKMLKENEVDAIYAYLQTVPAVYNNTKHL